MLAKAYSPILALVGAAVLLADPEAPKADPPPPPDAAQANPAAVETAAGDEEPPAPGDAGPPDAPEGEAGEAPAAAPGEPFSPRQAIERLGHDEFKVRAAAQQTLLEWGTGKLEEGIELLYEVYRTTDDPEVRLRSREVLRHLVLVKQPFDGEGYLGIQMENTRPHHVRNADGGLQPAVLVTQVREGTAAEFAKLKDNDYIIGVDQVSFDDLDANKTLQDYIMSKKPGDRITLHVRRDEETLALTASLRRRSPLLDRANQFGMRLELPPQEELDEADFQDWLKGREAERQKKAERAGKAPAAP